MKNNMHRTASDYFSNEVILAFDLDPLEKVFVIDGADFDASLLGHTEAVSDCT
jgi:hypothetical protein